MNKHEIISTAGSVDWEPVDSPNPLMLSFRNEIDGARANIYFTTGTVTIQRGSEDCKTYRNITIDQLEKVLTDYYG